MGKYAWLYYKALVIDQQEVQRVDVGYDDTRILTRTVYCSLLSFMSFLPQIIDISDIIAKVPFM